MKDIFQSAALLTLLAWGSAAPVLAQETLPGAQLEGLLAIAKASNPDYASMRKEAQAASERVVMAGALMDPKFRVEWMDITKGGSQSATLLPNETGSTKYTFMQDLPWWGKRDLKRAIAGQEAQAVDGKAQGTWAELAAKVKTTHAQRYFLYNTKKLTQELLDLTNRLSNVAQVRYAGGLAMQQDAIRAQVEQTTMQTELVALESEARQADARLNALLARPSSAPLAAPERLSVLPAAEKFDADSLLERAHQRNPQLFSEDARIKAAELSRELSLKNRYPDFTLAITPTQMQSRVTEWGLMLEMNIPLQQGTRRAQEREAQAMLAAAQSRREAVANQVASDLSENLAGIQAAQRTEQLVKTSLLPQAELTFQAALAGYENGKLDFATLLDAQRQIRQARLGQLKAQVDAQMRLAEIEKLLGEEL
ncbi:TolC family protein [Rhodoferax fermentans]|uniref:Transporter n=1 Tax=Rhodoferax fermentans TaxID=28066 RepID=A0A1T1AMJ8_RHOFE|nr:TolC family protein [Rhodoferax fermentans]MBK1683960.1 TolC family protein [Rhodoferax fermentans]OOV05381.1 transporter [Rhodoferax fermentans]